MSMWISIHVYETGITGRKKKFSLAEKLQEKGENQKVREKEEEKEFF